MNKVVKIGCSSGFWGDSPTAATQLVRNVPDLHYLVSDYLAEITMCILARQKNQSSSKGRGGMGEGGYVKEYVDTVWKPLMKEIITRKIKIVTNAGGMNPKALKAAIEQVTSEAGLPVPVVAAVTGDDLLPRVDDLRERKLIRKFSMEGEEEDLWPESQMLMSFNAYLGAFPIADALDNGAQIVVTGRCVDSALVLGPLIHEFKWKPTDYDLLSSGSLAGHLIECGCQCTGGNFTDWEESAASGWDNVGYPVAECKSDGSIVITKPENTGGIVTKASVAEQMLYEIHDPGAYILPDVICDWRTVTINELPSNNGKPSNRVAIKGARGRPPTPFFKASVTTFDGFRIAGSIMIGGIDAAEKGRAVAEAILKKTRRLLKQRGMEDFIETNVELLGAENIYGPHARTTKTREVIVRIAARHSNQKALEILAVEVAPSATSMAPGITGSSEGRPRPVPVIRFYSCLVPRVEVPITLDIDKDSKKIELLSNPPTSLESVHPPPLENEKSIQKRTFASDAKVKVPLIKLCWARSGDKGDTANIGLIARKPEYYELLKKHVTPEDVYFYMGHLIEGGKVRRYDVPGIHGFNFVLTHSLGGGGVSSLRMDRQGKTYGQILLDMVVEVPIEWVTQSKL